MSKDVDKTNSVSVEAISQLESMGFSARRPNGVTRERE